jgi:hypothetical protein
MSDSDLRNVAKDLQCLSRLSAEELADRLRQYFESMGGLTFDSDKEIARECVRRARRAERAESGEQDQGKRLRA